MNSTNTQDTMDFPSWEEMSDLEQARCTYWDMYKDAHGVRPRGMDTSTWTLEDFDREFQYLGRVIQQEEADRKLREQQAVVHFEHRLNQLIKLGAKTRETALKWCLEADKARDLEELAYTNNLPWNYFRNTQRPAI